MKKFGLIGKEIQASSSPALFKAAYGGKWNYELLDGDDFSVLFGKFKKEYDAVNVTAPFKEQALAACDEATESALLCGAANMLVRKNGGKVLADNSDFEGVTLSLMSAYAVQGIDVDNEDGFAAFLSGKTALVVGCGGAGKAAAAACLTLGFGKTVIANRNADKASGFVGHLREFYGDIRDDELEAAPLSDVGKIARKADLIVYTIPCEIAAEWDFNAGQTVLEANYTNPSLEKFKDGCNYICGLNWLYNQAVISFETFTGEEPDEERMKKTF